MISYTSHSLPFRIICCFLVCLILFCSTIVPVKVYAFEPISMTVVGVAAVTVIAGILIAIGIRPLIETSIEGFQTLIDDIVASLPAEWIVISETGKYWIKSIMADGYSYAPRNLVEWVLNYLVSDSGLASDSFYPVVMKASFMHDSAFDTFYDGLANHSSPATIEAFLQNVNSCYRIVDSNGWFSHIISNSVTLSDDGTKITISKPFYAAFATADNEWKVLASLTGTGTLTYSLSLFLSGSIDSFMVDDLAYDTLSDSLTLDLFADALDDSKYATWTGNSISVTDTLIGTDVAAVPVPMVDTLTDVISIPQTKAQAISVPVADTATLAITNTGSIAVSAVVPFDFGTYTTPTLRNFFPFCIPFDLYAMMQALCADPVAPSFTFATSFLGKVYTVNIDLSAWNGVAQNVRYMVVAIYIVALAVATRKFIKW